jgi:hypothetical protein
VQVAIGCRMAPPESLAQVRVPSGDPITRESVLTSGYLLVEARSPLPEPTRKRLRRQ